MLWMCVSVINVCDVVPSGHKCAVSTFLARYFSGVRLGKNWGEVVYCLMVVCFVSGFKNDIVTVMVSRLKSGGKW